MATKILNLEIGERIVKACISVKHGKGYRIEDSFMFQPPELSVSDGQIIDPGKLSSVLGAQLGAHDALGIKNVTFTLNSSKVVSREVTLPNVPDKRLKSVIEANASDYFPVDMSGYKVSYSLLERKKGDDGSCRVMVVAAPKVLLEGYVNLAMDAGLTIQAIDYAGNSQYQVLKGIQAEGVNMYVDVSVNNTLITFVKEGVQLLQRNLPSGGHDMINAVLMAEGEDNSHYLKALSDCEDVAYVDMTLSPQHRTLSRLVNGISRSAEFFLSQNPGEKIEQAVLMGTCCKLVGLKEAVEKETGVSTVLINELPIGSVANSAEGISAYISCIGSLIAPVDLLPESAKQKKNRKNADEDMTLGWIVLVGGILIGLALSGVSFMNYRSTVRELEDMNKEIEELAYVEDVHNMYEAYELTKGQLTALGDYSKTNNAHLVDFLKEMERKMPTHMLLLTAVCDEGGVTLNVNTSTMDEADLMISQLRKFDSVEDLRINTITETTDEAGNKVVSFSVTASYVGQAEAEEEAAAAAAAAAASQPEDED